MHACMLTHVGRFHVLQQAAAWGPACRDGILMSVQFWKHTSVHSFVMDIIMIIKVLLAQYMDANHS